MKFRIIMAALFCVGVLTVGVGSGIMFREYSSFTYGGKINLYENDVLTQNYKFELPKGNKDDKILLNFDRYNLKGYKTVPVESMNNNEIVFEVTYNKAFASPRISLEELYSEDSNFDNNGEKAFVLRNQMNPSYSDFKIITEHMDTVLENFKNHKIIELSMDFDYEVTIKTSPENIDKISYLYQVYSYN
ncbi:MAG: hypothetical protein RR315_02390 [Oscillospiraceae bacterium]